VAGRITRKELKTDKFAVEVEHTVDFVTEHRRQLVVYGSIAVVAIVIAIGVLFYMRRQHTLREQALGEAIEIQEAPVGPPNPAALVSFPTEEAKRAAAAKAFNEIAGHYSGSNEAAVAKYYLGATAADQGNMADAAKLFQEAASGGDSNYASLARFSLAQAYFGQGRSADAEKILHDLMAHPTVFVSKEQATIALAKGITPARPDEARKLLEPLRTVTGAVSQVAITAVSELLGQQ
jgi:predicted negative regulator of RcsB-dependent stress response